MQVRFALTLEREREGGRAREGQGESERDKEREERDKEREERMPLPNSEGVILACRAGPFHTHSGGSMAIMLLATRWKQGYCAGSSTVDSNNTVMVAIPWLTDAATYDVEQHCGPLWSSEPHLSLHV